MTLRERITIQAPPEAVWPWIADPVRVAEWNPKLVAIDRERAGPLRPGERFRDLFRLGGRDRESVCEVIDSREPSELVVRHRPVRWPEDRYVDERCRLHAAGAGTRFTQEIDLSHSGIARLLQLLMWVIHCTGMPVGKRHMESLKELVENRCDGGCAKAAATPSAGHPG